MSVLEKAGVHEMKYFSYSSRGIARQLFLTLRDVIRDKIA